MASSEARGFTLIELLVVIAIIGILATVSVGQYQRSVITAKEAVLKQNLFTMRSLIQTYFADKGHFPADLADLVEDRYLREVPLDPVAKSNDTWVMVMATPDEGDLFEDPGVVDVFSGAGGVALDGSAYSEW